MLLVAGFGGFALVQKLFQNTPPATQVQQAEPQKEFDQVAEFMPQCQKHFEAQRLTTAQACYQEVLKNDPDNPQALVDLKAIHLAELHQKEQAQVAKFMPQCQKHFDAQRLTTGRGGTALACYQKVLRLDPDNPQALAGLKAIENRYVEWAKKALSQKRFDKVEKYLTSLEKVNPDSPALADLRVYA